MNRISRNRSSEEGVWFGHLRIALLLFADSVVLLASSTCDLQQALGRFAAECEASRNEGQHLKVGDHGFLPENGDLPSLVGR